MHKINGNVPNKPKIEPTIIYKKQNAIIFWICEKNKQNPKTFWRTINVILPNKKQSDNNILLKDQTNNEIIPDNDIPNFINTYFTLIGPKLAQKCINKTYE